MKLAPFAIKAHDTRKLDIPDLQQIAVQEWSPEATERDDDESE